MKPCAKNRKRIVWLALDALDARQAAELRAHIEACAGCRRYLEEISKITETLRAAETRTGLQASESFHQRIAGALRAGGSQSLWGAVVAPFHGLALNWRVASPVLGAIAAALLLFALMRPPGAPLPLPSRPEAVPAPKPDSDLSPTLANYQKAVDQSLEELDELLTRQAKRISPPTPIYRASTLALANASD